MLLLLLPTPSVADPVPFLPDPVLEKSVACHDLSGSLISAKGDISVKTLKEQGR